MTRKLFRGVEGRRWDTDNEAELSVALVPYIPPPMPKPMLHFIKSTNRNQTATTNNNNNPTLTTDIIPLILSYCDAPTLSRASIVSHSFYHMATCNNLWNELCRDEFGVDSYELRPRPDPTRLLYVMSWRRLREMMMCVSGSGGSRGVRVIPASNFQFTTV
mmetsp:Transcript_20921/g.45297  ORF Transcript_20921/g.45297 Transcript_20921/m.45297 type:complete len:161 (-) Transcript_20921:135-617(-)